MTFTCDGVDKVFSDVKKVDMMSKHPGFLGTPTWADPICLSFLRGTPNLENFEIWSLDYKTVPVDEATGEWSDT